MPYRFATITLLVVMLLSACAPQPAALPTPDLTLTAFFDQALLDATRSIPTVTPTPVPPTVTVTPTFTPTPVRTPPTLPVAFQTDRLNKLDVPQPYVEDTCQYLRAKWDPNNSAPGTVVMPIMFHRITDEVNQVYQISEAYLDLLLRDLHKMGFETISMQQMAGFLQRNEKIPARSVLLIVDDLHTEAYYRTFFEPYFKEFGWTSVTNAWISEPEASKRVLEGNRLLQDEGWVDHQAHGVIHNVNIYEAKPGTYITTPLYGTVSADEYAYNELNGAYEAITEAFGKAPIAYIWPGGSFSRRGVEIAREVGYQLGFTVNPRGPIMYNWVPQAAADDPARPSYASEGYINDPLMLLPRYWDADAQIHLDTVRLIGKEAADYAEANRQTELEYYEIVCSPKLGPLPTPSP